MWVSIASNSSELLSVVLSCLDHPSVEGIALIDTGGRSITYNIAVTKMIDVLSLKGKSVVIMRYRDPLDMLSLRKMQVSAAPSGKSVLLLDDDMYVSGAALQKFGDLEHSREVVAHTVASVDDAEGFGVKSPIVGNYAPVKWEESAVQREEYNLNFWSACTLVSPKAIKVILGIGTQINEGEEVIIEKVLKSSFLKASTLSGFGVFHLGNEWSKADLIRKLTSMRDAL